MLSSIEELIDRRIHSRRKNRKRETEVELCGYRSFGCGKNVFVHGRLIESSGIVQPQPNDNILDNIRNMYRRFHSREIPGAIIEISVGGMTTRCQTNEEGYFQHEIKLDKDLEAVGGWSIAKLTLIAAPFPVKGVATTEAHIYMPSMDAEFGIISDIDDTIIESFATNKIKMFRTVISKNSRTRAPFEGVSAFYHALQRGAKSVGQNPIFFVSSSPWNLYDFLLDFLTFRDIPYGPLLLRDTGVDKEGIGGKNHLSHKLAQIDRIMSTYPDLKFILIGDSGQKDPMIYSEVVERYPDRVQSIYIRDVKLPERAEVVIKLAQDLTARKVPMILVENTARAAEHAVTNGWIGADWLSKVKLEKAMDDQTHSTLGKETPSEVAKDAVEQVEAADAEAVSATVKEK